MQESILTQQSDTLPEISIFSSDLASSHGKDFERLFAENVNPANEKVTLSYAFLRALKERHADDQKRIAELESQLLSLKNEVLEKAAVTAWNACMETCKKNGIGPSGWEHWCAATEIRKLKDVL